VNACGQREGSQNPIFYTFMRIQDHIAPSVFEFTEKIAKNIIFLSVRGECSKMPRVSKMPIPLKTYCKLQICILVRYDKKDKSPETRIQY